MDSTAKNAGTKTTIDKDKESLQNNQAQALNKAFDALFDMYAPADIYKALSDVIKDIITSPNYQENNSHSTPDTVLTLLDLKESLLNCTLLLSPNPTEDILSISNDSF
jgi:hypothetical protein